MSDLLTTTTGAGLRRARSCTGGQLRRRCPRGGSRAAWSAAEAGRPRATPADPATGGSFRIWAFVDGRGLDGPGCWDARLGEHAFVGPLRLSQPSGGLLCEKSWERGWREHLRAQAEVIDLREAVDTCGDGREALD